MITYYAGFTTLYVSWVVQQSSFIKAVHNLPPIAHTQTLYIVQKVVFPFCPTSAYWQHLLKNLFPRSAAPFWRCGQTFVASDHWQSWQRRYCFLSKYSCSTLDLLISSAILSLDTTKNTFLSTSISTILNLFSSCRVNVQIKQPPYRPYKDRC